MPCPPSEVGVPDSGVPQRGNSWECYRILWGIWTPRRHCLQATYDFVSCALDIRDGIYNIWEQQVKLRQQVFEATQIQGAFLQWTYTKNIFLKLFFKEIPSTHSWRLYLLLFLIVCEGDAGLDIPACALHCTVGTIGCWWRTSWKLLREICVCCYLLEYINLVIDIQLYLLAQDQKYLNVISNI